MDEMGNVEQTMRNSLHALEVMYYGLITWSLVRSFLVEFAKYSMVVHAFVNPGWSPLSGRYLMDEYRSYLIPLLDFSPFKVFWVQSGYGCGKTAWTNTMDKHCKMSPIKT